MIALAWLSLALGGLARVADEMWERATFRRASDRCRRAALRRRIHWRCD